MRFGVLAIFCLIVAEADNLWPLPLRFSDAVGGGGAAEGPGVIAKEIQKLIQSLETKEKSRIIVKCGNTESEPIQTTANRLLQMLRGQIKEASILDTLQMLSMVVFEIPKGNANLAEWIISTLINDPHIEYVEVDTAWKEFQDVI